MTSLLKSEVERDSTLITLRLPLVGAFFGKVESIDHRFGYPALSMVTRGRGFFQAGDAKKIPVQAPFFFYVQAGCHYHYGPAEGSSWDERFVVFSGERVSQWQAFGWLPEHSGPHPLSDITTWIRSHERILQLLSEERGPDTDRAKLEVERLVFDLFRERERPLPRNREIRARIEAWRKDPGAPRDMREEARRCGLSYSRFRERVREACRNSPHQILLELRIDHAARQLIETNDAIKKIAAEAGFESLEGFYKAFTKKAGRTPAVHRAHVREWNRQGK